MVTKFELDNLAMHGCQSPDCDHAAHGEVYLHSRCHTDCPMFLFAARPSFAGVCAKCKKVCIRLEMGESNLEGRFQNEQGLVMGLPDGTFYQNCHPDSAVGFRYKFGSGAVEVLCYECKAVVGKITVK